MKLFLILLVPISVFSQRNCSGLVVDKITGKIIPYTTVGLVKENKGVSANEQGAFSIRSSYPGDTLRVSSVGYKTELLPVSGWMDGTVVSLQQEANILREVVISANTKRPEYTLNSFGGCSSNWYQTGLYAINQLAKRFDAPDVGMQLTGLELCKDASESMFRLRIYDIDSNCNCPSGDLSVTIIEVKAKEKRVTVDLKGYDIIIPGKSFFIAIEWLFIPSNEAHVKMKINGKKTDWTYYKPAIRFERDRNWKQGNSWILGFNGKWIEAAPNHSFQITAKLK